MGKKIFVAVILALCFMRLPHAEAGEEITLSTYYPAPYGAYNALSVGRTYVASADDNLVVEGNVGIGTTSPGTHRLSVVGTAGLSTGTAWTNTSDRRWKNVQNELRGSSLDKILALRPISYTWNELHDQQFGKNPGLKYGFIAQDVESIFSDMISKDDKGYYWYNPSGMEAILTAAIQEQQDIIKAQQRELDGLKARLDKLEDKNGDRHLFN